MKTLALPNELQDYRIWGWKWCNFGI